MSDQDALYPIREISRLTGVTPITLRAWERRYDLIEPIRTDSGHRLYTQAHVDFIKQALELTKQGIPISKVKSVLLERQAAQKAVRASGDIDFTAELISACLEFNYLETQQLVEQSFVDLLEEQVQEVIVEVTLGLQDSEPAVQVLWQSVVVPLLSSRIRQGRRLLDKIGRRNIYIGSIDGEQNVLQRVMANIALESGFNPMLSFSTSHEDLMGTLQKLNCEALLMISPKSSAETFAKWQSWAVEHPSVEFYFATNSDSLVSDTLNLKVISLLRARLI